MDTHIHGIVLRMLPGNNKIAILTESIGKIIVYVFEKHIITRIKPGTHIQLQGAQQQGGHVISTKTIILVTPLSTACTDFYWLHHLLELCYYFIPLHQHSSDIFRLLAHCFALTSITYPPGSGWEFIKKSITAVLLLLFGFHPPEELKKYLYNLKNSLLLFIDFEPQQKVKFVLQAMRSTDQSLSTQLDSWIIASIHTHPRIEFFKTLNFMYRPSKPSI